MKNFECRAPSILTVSSKFVPVITSNTQTVSSYVAALLGHDSETFCGRASTNIAVVACFSYDNAKERHYKTNTDNNDF